MTYVTGLSGIEHALDRIADAITRLAIAQERLADSQHVPMDPPVKKQLLLDQKALENILAETTIDTEHG